jgi:hypothetical protein
MAAVGGLIYEALMLQGRLKRQRGRRAQTIKSSSLGVLSRHRPRTGGARSFHEQTGPLTDQSLPKAERESFAHLFAGAIGAYKNPHSHRKVTIDSLREAQCQVLQDLDLLPISSEQITVESCASLVLPEDYPKASSKRL